MPYCFAPRSLHLNFFDAATDDPGYARSNLILKIEHVCQHSIEAIGPEMRTRLAVDELARNA